MVKLCWLNAKHGFFFSDFSCFDQFHGDTKGRLGGTFSVSGLKDVELTFFNGKLDILHIFIVFFEDVADFLKLLIDFRIDFMELIDGNGGADAGDDIFSLCVHQEFPEEIVFTGGRVTRKGNTRPAVVSHVSVDHGLNVDSCS